MKRTVDMLSEKDKALLVDLYDSDVYKSLRKLIENERDQLAKSALSVDPARLLWIQGGAHSLKQLHLVLKDLHAESEKKA